MAKKNNTIFLMVGIAVLVLLLINFQTTKTQQTDLEEGVVGLNPHYYRDGVEVFPSKGLFTIVTPPGLSFTEIAYDIPGVATGEIPFSNIKIVDALPLAFKNALPTTTQSLMIGASKTLWTSGLMNTEQFESMVQPVNFWVKVSAVDDYTGETVYAEGYSDIIFEPEALEGLGNIHHIKIVDSTSGITYNWASGVWDTSPQATGGDNVMFQAGIQNQGDVADIIWGEFSSAQVTVSGALAVSPWNMDVGTIWGPQWNFVMPTTDVSITINAGHLQDTTYIEDDTQSFTIKLPEPFSSFYQETANSYSFTDDWMGSSYCAFDWNKFKDGSWTTYLTTASKGDACAGQATMVYQKPSGATSAVWKVKDERGTVNLNIPSSCWSASSTDLTLRYRSRYGTANYIIWECYDGGTGYEGYTTLRYESGIGYPTAYEEAVTWN